MQIELADGGVVVVVVDHKLALLTIHLREQEKGDGDWRLVHLSATAHDGGSLAPSVLKELPVASSVADAVSAARSRLNGVFTSPSQILTPAWKADRRGRAARSPEDYAHLAVAYAAAPIHLRSSLPREWAARYPGSERTWRDRISKLRREGYLDANDELSDTAFRLAYGEDIHERLRIENEIEKWERIADGYLGREELESFEAKGLDRDAAIRFARQVVRDYYPTGDVSAS
jgi:hypothetical protein